MSNSEKEPLAHPQPPKKIKYELNRWYDSPSNAFKYTIGEGSFAVRVILNTEPIVSTYCKYLYGTQEQIERFVADYLFGSPKAFTELPEIGVWGTHKGFTYIIYEADKDKYNLAVRHYKNNNFFNIQESHYGKEDDIIDALNDYAILFGIEEAFRAMLSEQEPITQPEPVKPPITSVKEGDHYKLKAELDVRVELYTNDDYDDLVIISFNDHQFTITEKGAIRFLDSLKDNLVKVR